MHLTQKEIIMNIKLALFFILLSINVFCMQENSSKDVMEISPSLLQNSPKKICPITYLFFKANVATCPARLFPDDCVVQCFKNFLKSCEKEMEIQSKSSSIKDISSKQE